MSERPATGWGWWGRSVAARLRAVAPDAMAAVQVAEPPWPVAAAGAATAIPRWPLVAAVVAWGRAPVGPAPVASAAVAKAAA